MNFNILKIKYFLNLSNDYKITITNITKKNMSKEISNIKTIYFV